MSLPIWNERHCVVCPLDSRHWAAPVPVPFKTLQLTKVINQKELATVFRKFQRQFIENVVE